MAADDPKNVESLRLQRLLKPARDAVESFMDARAAQNRRLAESLHVSNTRGFSHFVEFGAMCMELADKQERANLAKKLDAVLAACKTISRSAAQRLKERLACFAKIYGGERELWEVVHEMVVHGASIDVLLILFDCMPTDYVWCRDEVAAREDKHLNEQIVAAIEAFDRDPFEILTIIGIFAYWFD